MTEPETQTPTHAETDPLVLKRIEQFRDMKFSLMLHWGIYSVWGAVESWPICAAEPYGRAELPAWAASGQDPDRFMHMYFDMGEQWSYNPRDSYKSARELIHTLVKIMARGGNLLLNVGLDPQGITLCLPEMPCQSPPGAHAWTFVLAGAEFQAARPITQQD